jgi:hypothetical protein
MWYRALTKLASTCVIAAALSGCVVEHRVERPRGCRHAVWVDRPHGGYWRCEHPHRRPARVIIVP